MLLPDLSAVDELVRGKLAMNSQRGKAMRTSVLAVALLMVVALPGPGYAVSARGVVMSELAWVGTTNHPGLPSFGHQLSALPGLS